MLIACALKDIENRLLIFSFLLPSQAEVIYLGQLRHPHVVKLIGYCCEEEQRLLVYEFMARGSLENHLFKSTPCIPNSRPSIHFLSHKIMSSNQQLT